MKALGIDRTAGGLTEAEYSWYLIHSLLDDGYSYCVACQRPVQPISVPRSRHSHIEIGGEKIGYAEGLIEDPREPKSYAALFCPQCGDPLHDGVRRPEDEEDEDGGVSSREQWCGQCERRWGAEMAFCPQCGGFLADDVFGKIERQLNSPNFDLEAFMRNFEHVQMVPLEIHERFAAFGDGRERNTEIQAVVTALQEEMEIARTTARKMRLKNAIRGMMRGELTIDDGRRALAEDD